MAVTTLDRAISTSNELVNAAYSNPSQVRGLVPMGSGASLQAGPNMNMLMGGPEQERHAEQYKHYRGWPYAAIRAISYRMAMQELNLGLAAESQRQQAEFVFSHHKAGLREFEQKTILDSPSWINKGKEELYEITDHELLDTLRQPNPAMSFWELMVVTVSSLELTGKSFWVLVPDDDDGWTMWYIPAHWITPDHKQGLFAEWKIRNPSSSNKSVSVPGNLVSWFGLPDPATMWENRSPIDSQRLAVETDEAIMTAQRAGFDNQGLPGLVLTVGRLPGVNGPQGGTRPHLTAEQRGQLFDIVLGHYESVLNHREPLLLDGLIENVEKLTMSPEEMDFTDSAKGPESRILRTYGTNPFVLGEMENANRASAAAAEQNLCDGVINPLLSLMGQVFSKTAGNILMPERPASVRTWFNPCHARDREMRLREWVNAGKLGMVTIDEYRKEILRVGPLPENKGNVLVAPGSYQIIDLNSSAGQNSSEASARSKTKGIRVKSSKSTKETGKLALQVFVKQVGRHEKSVEAVLRQFFRDEDEKLIKEIVGMEVIVPALVAEAFDESAFLHRMQQVLIGPLSQAMAEGASVELGMFGQAAARRGRTIPKWVRQPLDIDPDDIMVDLPPRLLSRIRTTLQENFNLGYWRQTVANAKDDVMQAIRQGLSDGLDVGRIERLMRDKLGRRGAVQA